MSHTAYFLRFVWSLVWTIWTGLVLYNLTTAAPAKVILAPCVGMVLVWVLMVFPRYWWRGRVGWAWVLLAGFPLFTMVTWAFVLPVVNPGVVKGLHWADVVVRVVAVMIIGAVVWTIGVAVSTLWRKAASLGRAIGL